VLLVWLGNTWERSSTTRNREQLFCTKAPRSYSLTIESTMTGYYLLCRNYVNSNLSVYLQWTPKEREYPFSYFGSIIGSWHSREEASITVNNIKSAEVMWADSVHEEASTHGKKSSAEACAKHLKEAIENQ